MIREFSNITRGKILEELVGEGLTKLSPLQFLRVEKKMIAQGIIPAPRRNGGGWRIYTRDEANLVKEKIWDYYGGKQ